MRVTFVRHGQSTSNAGEMVHDLDEICLTDLGWQQAKAVAASWTAAPSYIISSPFLRAMQTAEPTCERFAAKLTAVWPIQEFVYLQPSHWIGTTREQRRPTVDAYWQRADPDFVDGPGAESFANVLRRAEAALARVTALPDNATPVLFSHSQFIQAMRLTLMFPGATDAQKMASFWPFDQRSPVLNGQKVELVSAHGELKLVDTVGSAALDVA